MLSGKRNNKHFYRLKRTSFLLVALCAAVACWSPQLLAADSNVNVKVCYPVPDPAPTITGPADGTKTQDASILMSGQATPNVPVYAYRNDVQVGFVTAGGDGVFAIGIGLDVGTNSLKASTNNDCHPPAYSSVVTVERGVTSVPIDPVPGSEQNGGTPITPNQSEDEAPPTDVTPAGQPATQPSPKEQPLAQAVAPAILRPRNGVRVREPFVIVIGETTPNTVVRILRNDQLLAEVLSDDEGRFTARIPLEPGPNRLMVAVGPLFSETTIVTYDPLKPPGWSIWLMRGGIILAGTGLMALAIFFIWQPTLMKRTWHGLKRWKR